MQRNSFWLCCLILCVLCDLCGYSALQAQPLARTKPLTQQGDLAAQMVAGIDKYLMRELAASVEKRKQFWKPDFSSPAAYAKSVQPNRERLRKMLGVVDQRVPPHLEYVGGPDSPALRFETDRFKVFAVRWSVLPGVDAEGLVLEPKGNVRANVVAVPDADEAPEVLAGIQVGTKPRIPYARRLAEAGCRVLVPTLIDRSDLLSGSQRLGRFTNLSNREFIYRMAYEMGRGLIGYEVQKVLAAVDWFQRPGRGSVPSVGVLGYGEGGLIALASAALDERVKAVCVAGYFSPPDRLWSEPIDRNVWGFLREFGDAELGALVAPRGLFLEPQPGGERERQHPEWYRWPEVAGPPTPRPGRSGAAPGKLGTPSDELVRAEIGRFLRLMKPLSNRDTGWYGGVVAFVSALTGTGGLGREPDLRPLEKGKGLAFLSKREGAIEPADGRHNFDPAARQKRQFDQLVTYTQRLWHLCDDVRRDFWKKADPSSPQKWEASCEWYRNYFWEEVIGKLPAASLPPNPRTRPIYDTPKWRGYEVMLDVHPDVFAYGILLLPKDLKPGEKRPVVVCQHGLEGRPTDVCNPKQRTRYYNSFGAQLADLGYIVYAPQNPYIGEGKFRILQRKGQPLKLSLFSFIIEQHRVTLDWLATLPFVDANKIAFYGLSYGGKTAMRVPAVLKRYCLSICSGDFNEWIGKNVSVDFRGSYIWSIEYDMYEFDLGNTFNYAEMAYLIAPRPFMVERGHDDGVGIDEMIASEYAKVRYLYAKLKIPERTAIEFFSGHHEIHGVGTFAFLKRHLGWPR